ncbi:MAG: DUF2279 domain-containing protein [Prolixibacteraceae bacterium]|nr:DUF2279 domain-containing protein [Burkholderiales bacterium]
MSYRRVRRSCHRHPCWHGTLIGAALGMLALLPEAFAGEGRDIEGGAAAPANASLNVHPGMQAAQTAIDTEPVSEETRRFRTRLVLLGAPAGVALYGASSWWGSEVSDFHVVHEGWFGQETYAGGADKLGHGFSAYLGMRLATWALEWAGNSHVDAMRTGSLLSLGTFMAIEMFDGFSEDYGFSVEDAVISVAGIGMGYALERYPALDEVLDFRIRYRRSDDAKRLGEYDPVSDYSGQTFFMVAKAAGFPKLRSSPWTRYLELAVGYGTRGYEPNDGSPNDPRRLLFVGISLNLSEILNDTVFRKHRGSTGQELANGVLEFFQVPGTGVYADHRL